MAQATGMVRKTEVGSWMHVYAPTKGLITSISPTLLPKESSPYMKGVYLKNGEIRSDYGYVAFPVAGKLKTNVVHGVPLKFDQFTKWDGTAGFLCLTTTNAYHYNTTSNTWDCVTRNVLVDDCEDAWNEDVGAGVVSILDKSITGAFTKIEDYSGTVPGTVLVTAGTHGLSTGHSVVIAGVITTYNGTYNVTVVNANTFYFTHAFTVTTTGTFATDYCKLRGSGSVKISIPTAFTGIAATEVITDVDRTTATALHFWIRSSVATTAGQLQVGIDETAKLAGTPLYFDVPVLVANTWTPCCVDGTFTGYDHAISVGLNVVGALGAGAIVWIDDVRAATRFTGDVDDMFSSTTMLNQYVVTNNKDKPQKYDGVTTTGFTLLGDDLLTSTDDTSALVFTFKDHICLCNNTEKGEDLPARVSWSNIGSITNFTTGTAGYQDLLDDESWIMAAEQVGENEYIIYKERSIVLMTWVGGHTPFRFKTIVDGTGVVGKDAVVNVTGVHYCFGQNSLFTYDRSTGVKYLPDLNRQYIYDLVNRTYINRVSMLYIEEDSEIQVWMPTTTEYPDTVFSIDRELGTWFRRDKAMIAYGFYREVATKTIGDLTGTIGEQNWTFGDSVVKTNYPITIVADSSGNIWKIDKNTLNNGETAITSEWQTPDFTYPDDTQYVNKYFRVPQLLYEAKGQTITSEWSEDGGATWNPTGSGGDNTQALTSSWEMYQQDFDVVARKIRFKFSKSTASQGFNLRYYGFYWLPRSGRS